MATQEDHVLESVQAHGTHGLLLDVGQLLLQLLHIPHHPRLPGTIVHDLSTAPVTSTNIVDGLASQGHVATVTMGGGSNIVLNNTGAGAVTVSTCGSVRNGADVDNFAVFVG